MKPLNCYRTHFVYENVDYAILPRDWAIIQSHTSGNIFKRGKIAALVVHPISNRYRFDDPASSLDAFLYKSAISTASFVHMNAVPGGSVIGYQHV